ncbi:MAG: toxin-antitoxin system HicB family antitoxin [Acidobacteria bacterium]|nr:toxin-antitoxin system HicB family antitoxin [Acidobacteriota bacterium]MBI3425242.1 toxin-antitoxin system HicB family antitoxin [Acidobacteriota bacterium]
MNTLSVQFPKSLHKNLHELAQREGISVDQFVATAVAEKIAALTTESYLAERASRATRAQYEAVLAEVPDVEPKPFDKLPES